MAYLVSLNILMLFIVNQAYAIEVKNTIYNGISAKEISSDMYMPSLQIFCDNIIIPLNNSYVWMYNSSESLPANLNATNKTYMIISNMNEKDSGSYDCCVMDIDSKYVCYRKDLSITQKPVTTGVDMRTVGYKEIAKNSRIYFWLFNDTVTTINCTIDNKTLPSNTNVSLVSSPYPQYKDMFINQATTDNSGNYTCSAMRSGQKVNTKFTIKVANTSSMLYLSTFLIIIPLFHAIF